MSSGSQRRRQDGAWRPPTAAHAGNDAGRRSAAQAEACTLPEYGANEALCVICSISRQDGASEHDATPIDCHDPNRITSMHGSVVCPLQSLTPCSSVLSAATGASIQAGKCNRDDRRGTEPPARGHEQKGETECHAYNIPATTRGCGGGEAEQRRSSDTESMDIEQVIQEQVHPSEN